MGGSIGVSFIVFPIIIIPMPPSMFFIPIIIIAMPPKTGGRVKDGNVEGAKEPSASLGAEVGVLESGGVIPIPIPIFIPIPIPMPMPMPMPMPVVETGARVDAMVGATVLLGDSVGAGDVVMLTDSK